MRALRFLNDYLELYLCIFLISLMTIVIAVQVFMRYVMRDSLSWSEELARYVFIWLIYLSISYGAKMIRHIKIEAALDLFPKSWRPYVEIVGDVLFLFFALFICYTGWFVIQRQLMLGQTSPALGLPIWIVYAAPVVGFFLTAIRQVQTIIYRCKHIGEEE